MAHGIECVGAGNRKAAFCDRNFNRTLTTRDTQDAYARTHERRCVHRTCRLNGEQLCCFVCSSFRLQISALLPVIITDILLNFPQYFQANGGDGTLSSATTISTCFPTRLVTDQPRYKVLPSDGEVNQITNT